MRPLLERHNGAGLRQRSTTRSTHDADDLGIEQRHRLAVEKRRDDGEDKHAKDFERFTEPEGWRMGTLLESQLLGVVVGVLIGAGFPALFTWLTERARRKVELQAAARLIASEVHTALVRVLQHTKMGKPP